MVNTALGPIDAPGSIHTDFLIHPQHAPGEAVIQVTSPSPSVSQGWRADVSEFDESNPNVLTSVSSAGRVLTIVLDLSAQPKILGTGEFKADVDVVQMVSGQPNANGEPNLFAVRSPQCLWTTEVTASSTPPTSTRGIAAPVPSATSSASSIPPSPSDGVTTYLSTKSGQVRCAVSTASVVCERNSVDGFPQAPVSTTGGRNWNLAAIDASGAFEWNEGNIGGPDPDDDLVLEYGQTQQLSGWTIDARSNGTMFTSEATGRGMFVSIENVYGF
ncbi:hypothetical protein [Mycolicibacterium lacusdiani]|uniref:hypothetical protein n=1 Tax=Mycolicibacterium lacusdiani TaxID=2895283 RepID=UPI001F452384|nr:hypothetical protein [Mycolicibacterium lacusdiani]